MANNDKDSLRGKLPGGLVFGANGKSAYQLAVENGFEGTVLEWLDSLQGKSAYAYAVDGGYTGTEEDFTKDVLRETLPIPSGAAQEGQLLRVQSVDEAGNIIALETIDKPQIPTKVSAFANDAGYLTEHQDISGKLDADKLPDAINDALGQAKASGEFDGQDGNDYVLTEADRIEIAEMAAGLVDVPGSGGNVENGIPPGGKVGQYLRKKSDADRDVEWADIEIPEHYGLITYDQTKTITIT